MVDKQDNANDAAEEADMGESEVPSEQEESDAVEALEIRDEKKDREGSDDQVNALYLIVAETLKSSNSVS